MACPWGWVSIPTMFLLAMASFCAGVLISCACGVRGKTVTLIFVNCAAWWREFGQVLEGIPVAILRCWPVFWSLQGVAKTRECHPRLSCDVCFPPPPCVCGLVLIDPTTWVCCSSIWVSRWGDWDKSWWRWRDKDLSFIGGALTDSNARLWCATQETLYILLHCEK